MPMDRLAPVHLRMPAADPVVAAGVPVNTGAHIYCKTWEYSSFGDEFFDAEVTEEDAFRLVLQQTATINIQLIGYASGTSLQIGLRFPNPDRTLSVPDQTAFVGPFPENVDSIAVPFTTATTRGEGEWLIQPRASWAIEGLAEEEEWGVTWRLVVIVGANTEDDCLTYTPPQES